MNDLEFIEETHQYLYKGVQIPCVSEIIGFKFPNIYNGVPKEVLTRAASYGTKAHEVVEKLLMKEISLEDIETMNIEPSIKVSAGLAKDLAKKWIITPKKVEQHVCYKGRYAGTYDMITEDDHIVDIKTTAKLHIDNDTLQAPLNLQISLYYMAAGIKKENGYVLWLPRSGEAKVLPVKCWEFDELRKLIKEYEKSKKQSDRHSTES